MHVKLERTHTLNGLITKEEDGIHLDGSIPDVIKQALEYSSDSQIGMFGDTGMDDGEYRVKVISIDDKPVPEEYRKEAGWEMVY